MSLYPKLSYSRDLFVFLLLTISIVATPFSVLQPISLAQPQDLTLRNKFLTGNTPSRPTGGVTGQFWVEAITEGLRLVYAIAPKAKFWLVISKPKVETTDPSDLTNFEIKCYDPKSNPGNRYIDLEGSIRTDEDREMGRVTWDQPTRTIGTANLGKRFLKWPPAHDVFAAALAASRLGHPCFNKVWYIRFGRTTEYKFLNVDS